jgi:hypothetical protein
MGETVKKSTRKPRKPKTASETTTPAKSRKKVATVNGNGSVTNGKVTEIRVSHEQVAMLAHKFWTERGYQHGHHEEDWLRAEQELLGKAS